MKKLNRKKQAKETQRENKLEGRPQPDCPEPSVIPVQRPLAEPLDRLS